MGATQERRCCHSHITHRAPTRTLTSLELRFSNNSINSVFVSLLGILDRTWYLCHFQGNPDNCYSMGQILTTSLYT